MLQFIPQKEIIILHTQNKCTKSAPQIGLQEKKDCLDEEHAVGQAIVAINVKGFKISTNNVNLVQILNNETVHSFFNTNCHRFIGLFANRQTDKNNFKKCNTCGR